MSIRNQYGHQNETRKFTVNKKWISNRGTEIEPPEGGTVEFTLFRSENGGAPERVTAITLDGTEEVPWAAVFRDLPSMNVDTGYSYSYMVKETAHPDDYLPYLSVSSGASPMAENDYQRVDGGTIYNRKQSIDVNLQKVDEKNDPLAGASFKLTQVDENGRAVPGGILKPSAAVDANGRLAFPDLIAGYYELEETVFPDGYVNKNTAKTVFRIGLDEDGELAVVFANTEMVTYDAGSRTFTVKNTPGKVLPSTGGTGTLPYTLGGLALLVAAALMYGFRMRRRERRLD